MMLRVLLAFALCLPSLPRSSGACTRVAPNLGPHALMPAHAADTSPPSMVDASATVLLDTGGGGCGGDSCLMPSIVLSVHATDDAAGPDVLGYEVKLVSGRLPDGMTLDDGFVLANTLSELAYYIPKPATRVDFVVSIRAVDGNGNVGPATELAIVN